MYPCMKLRHIEECLQDIDVFDKPKIVLEQYPTPPHLASHMLHTMQACYGDIESKFVADLGCGSGVLSLGASLLDADYVIGYEIDEDALSIFMENVEALDVTNVDAVQCNVLHKIPNRWHKRFDTVLMNPPFGTKHNAGIDMSFLRRAFQLSNIVYSLHKTSTRQYVLKTAQDCGAKGKVLAELSYDLPATFKFHKKQSVDIQVDFFRFEIEEQ